MRKVYLLFATAAMLAASCANDDFSGDNSNSLPVGDGSIAFNMNMPATSRAAGTANDAKNLNYEFIVWGDKTNNNVVSTVFENYRVQYKDNNGNTANTSVSNTNGWEYVGIAPYTTGVTPSITQTSQTIKYWDSTASSYTFTAVSAVSTDISSGKVAITRTSTDNATSTATTGYTITLKNGADATKIYVADKNSVTPTNYTSASNVQPVQMQFRNFQTKIRFGFYETVPGYKVKITGVKYGSNASSVSTNFDVDGQFVQVPTGTDNTDVLTYNVTYSDTKPTLTMTTVQSALKTSETFGSAIFNVELGDNANGAKYDKTENETNGAYTCILPNTGNETPMTFTVDYELTSEDTGEKIPVTGKKVIVPAQYCKWKPNYAYTYLFKISDQSAGLYPITFDAMVVADETGKQETITTVSEPSITTFATRTTDGKTTVVTSENEYKGGDVIYAYAQDGTSTAAMSATNMKLYKVTLGTGVTSEEVTEAAVEHALKNSSVANKKLTVSEITSSTEGVTESLSYEAIPGKDGVSRTITGMKWTATAGTYYAVEYIKTTTTEGSSDTTTTKYYKIVKVASGS